MSAFSPEISRATDQPLLNSQDAGNPLDDIQRAPTRTTLHDRTGTVFESGRRLSRATDAQ